MKVMLDNIFRGFKKPLCLLVFCFLINVILAQNNNQPDTNIVLTEDSSVAIEQPDSGVEHYFEHKTNEVLTDTIQSREVPANVVDSLKKDDAFWYADKIFKKKEFQEKDTKNRNLKLPSQWMSMTTLVIIVVLFLGVLIWYLFQNNIINRRESPAGAKTDEETDNENIFNIDYQKEIDSAINLANYRLAIRLMFLRLLKDLSQKNVIQYKQERTNFDYLSQLSSSRYYSDFFRLTRNYEYAWYGKFDVSRETFGIIKNEFESFDQKLF